MTNTGIDVATTSTAILAANTKRRYAAIVNDSDTAIYIALGAAAVVNAGIRLNASGGSFEILTHDMSSEAINGIHGGTGTKRVTVVEDSWP